MRLITIGMFIITVLAWSAPAADAHQRTWPGKRLAEAIPAAKKFTQKQVTLTAPQIEWMEKFGESVRTEDRSPSFYVGLDGKGNALGLVIFLDATGANGKIDLGVAIDTAGAVMRVVLYEHSESGSLASSDFLGQFAGKKAADKFKVGEDVKAPKGEDRAAQAIATAARRGLLLAMAGLRIGSK